MTVTDQDQPQSEGSLADQDLTVLTT